VACPFRRNGCTHVGALAYASSHKRDCSFNPSNLPEFLLASERLSSADADESTTGPSQTNTFLVCVQRKNIIIVEEFQTKKILMVYNYIK